MHQSNRNIIFYILILFCVSLYAPQAKSQFPSQDDDAFFTAIKIKKGENPEDKLNNNIFVHVITNKNSVFAGEPFLVEYKFYQSLNSVPSPGTQPTFNSCSVVEFSPFNEPETEMLNGKKYHVTTIRKVQLTPLQDGPLVLNEASVDNIVQLEMPDDPAHPKDFSFTATSKPVTIDVKPLPEKDKPIDFSGAVGNFTITTKTDSVSVPFGENAHLSVVIKGTGNIAVANLPVINWPANTDHFEAVSTDHINKENFPVSGNRTFTIPFVSKKEGVIIIPPVSFSYFDPIAQKYTTTYSDSLTVHITKAIAKQAQKEIVTEDITNRKYLWIVPAIALIVAFVLIISGKTQRKERKRQEILRQAKKDILPVPLPAEIPKVNFTAALKILALKNNDHDFYLGTKELLTKALQQKPGITTFNEPEILHELQLKKTDAVLIDAIQRIYKICNTSLYSPIANPEQRITVQEAITEVIKQLGV